jgi:hypothetical protein
MPITAVVCPRGYFPDKRKRQAQGESYRALTPVCTIADQMGYIDLEHAMSDGVLDREGSGQHSTRSTDVAAEKTNAHAIWTNSGSRIADYLEQHADDDYLCIRRPATDDGEQVCFYYHSILHCQLIKFRHHDFT